MNEWNIEEEEEEERGVEVKKNEKRNITRTRNSALWQTSPIYHSLLATYGSPPFRPLRKSLR